jgi:G3E family GTPase
MNVVNLHENTRRPNLVFVAGATTAGKSSVIRHLVRNGRRYGAAGLGAAPAEALPFLVEPHRGRRPHAHFLVELKGTDDPQTFLTPDVEGAGVSDSRVVTVVNAETALADFCSQELIRPRNTSLADDGARAVADVLTEQIEAADTLVLNKLDRTSGDRKEGLVALLTALNPGARILESQFGCVSPEVIFAGGSSAGPGASRSPGWQRALEGSTFPNAQRLGISSLVYREHRPFHPARLHALFANSWDGVVRARGYFWIASRPAWVVELSQAGAARRYRAVSTWWAEILKGRTVVPVEVAEFLGVPWSEEFGDRRQELAFVGVGLNVAALKSRLDACLLTPEELRAGNVAWERFPDPFPTWALEGQPQGRLSLH